MYIDRVSSQWRTNFPTLRYKNDKTTFDVLPQDVKETLYWASGADSFLMPTFFSDYDKTL